jgi:two-component system chemotaxis sensor kinase CheA
VGVKDVIRQLQVVVKPPTKEVAGREGIMGTTILGDGRPALIIDLLNLYQKKIKEEKTKELAA